MHNNSNNANHNLQPGRPGHAPEGEPGVELRPRGVERRPRRDDDGAGRLLGL